jgi:hypothetical protein
MRIPAFLRSAAALLLTSCVISTGCGGDPGELNPGDRSACSNLQDSGAALASGRFDVVVDGSTVGPWQLGVSHVPRPDGTHEAWFSACVLEGDGAETWRYSSIAFLEGPVRGTPVKLPVPQSRAPGFTGGLLNVTANREHHFLLRGAGELEVQEFDPDARRFVARGEMYPEMGGTVKLSWELTW